LVRIRIIQIMMERIVMVVIVERSFCRAGFNQNK
jgi:hypothetical protein